MKHHPIDGPVAGKLSPAGEAPDEVAVDIRDLTKIYGGGKASGVTAVDNVSLVVPKGKLVVLLGPSGCGKTTLLRCVAGLERPSAGRIQIGDHTVYSAERRVFEEPESRGLGMMFQSYALWPHMTVFQNVAYSLNSTPGLSAEHVRQTVTDVLETLGVPALDKRYPSELSGGQQQRVALARALVRNPSVLLFDEPLSNVDARIRRRLRAELRRLKETNAFSGIYVTHDQEEAMELADILAVMEAGKIVQAGATRDIYHRPASIYVADFIGEINRFEGVVSTVTPDGAALVDCELGRIEVSAAPTARAGDKGWLVVRPEDIHLDQTVPGGTVPVSARVIESVFLGPRSEVRMRIAGTDVQLSIADQYAPLPEAGTEIVVHLAKRGLRWLAS